jgi:hypothetical protein
MSPEIMNGIIQGGALVLLALVLWGISKKVDAVLVMAESVVMKLLDLIRISTSDNATRTQDAADNQENVRNPKNQ